MSNRLEHSASPYLLQHAQNPVDWYPWCDEAFQKAKKENKPVLISIGYSACHWCHVMENESFEDEKTAAFMNQYFINIKVDREEHPDVDHLYMDALQSMTGSGGWPLNIFVTPDRKPFYGGTYFPPKRLYARSSWLEVLDAVRKAWEEKPEEVERQAEQIIQHLKQASLLGQNGNENLKDVSIEQLVVELLKQADTVEGGFGTAPKFPSSMAIRFLLEFFIFQKRKGKEEQDLSKEALAHALLSLDKMIEGGIYDQIGGGFSRYSTDSKWLVPHFEKMLYDNALLLMALADAYQISGKEKYKEVMEETLEFCRTELSSDSDNQEGFYCALNADSEGVEGKFYVWTYEQYQQAVGDLHPALAAYFGVTKEGNWEEEGTNILHRSLHRKELLVHYSLPLTEWNNLLKEGKQKLFEKRLERIPPSVDDKILLSWNALMSSALSKLSIALKDEKYLKMANQHIDWLLQHFEGESGALFHAYKAGQAYISGNLDDYAFFIQALLDYASVSGKNQYILKANEYLHYVEKNFVERESVFFNFSPKDQKDILVPKIDLYDHVMPSANSVLADSFVKLGNLMEKTEWIEKGEKMMRHMVSEVARYPGSFSHWAILFQREKIGWKQFVISGPNAFSALTEWHNQLFPEIFTLILNKKEVNIPLFKGKWENNSDRFHLCSSMNCLQPVDSIPEILKELKKSDRKIV